MELRQTTTSTTGEVEKLKDPNYLPRSRKEICRLVGAHLLDRFGDSRISYTNARTKFMPDPDLYPLALGNEGMFEVLNAEFINKLTNYLADRTKQFPNAPGRSRVIEVGAGRGRLAHFVNQRANVMGFDLDVTASDSGNIVGIYGVKDPLPVVKEDYRLSLLRNPQIVISSWMPPSEDWTPDFRKTASVQEYILIGQPQNCGSPRAWGDQDGEIIDGFQRVELDDISDSQVGFMDDLYPYAQAGQQNYYDRSKMSRTVSFRRV